MSLARTLLRKSQQGTFVRGCGLRPKISSFACKTRAQDPSLGKSLKLGNHFYMNKKSMWSKYRYVTHLPLVTANCSVPWEMFSLIIGQSTASILINKSDFRFVFLISAPTAALLRLQHGKDVEWFLTFGFRESIRGHCGSHKSPCHQPSRSQRKPQIRCEILFLFTAGSPCVTYFLTQFPDELVF